MDKKKLLPETASFFDQPLGGEEPSASSRIWFDVEDLFEFCLTHKRPSGIQRVAFEIQKAVCTLPRMEHRVGFLRHTANGRRFYRVGRKDVEDLYITLLSSDSSDTSTVVTPKEHSPTTDSVLKKVLLRLPIAVRVPLGRLRHDQKAVFSDLRLLAKGVSLSSRQHFREKHIRNRKNAEFAPERHDIIMSLGAAWGHPDYGSIIEYYRKNFDIRFGLLVHDIIPLIGPEWCPQGLPRIFRRWLKSTLPQTDIIFTVSRKTSSDFERFYPNTETETIRLATPARSVTSSEAVPPPTGSRYVLCVGTIEVRKNHLYLFNLWKKMLQEKPVADMPALVIAGAPGWLTHDVMLQIENSNFLSGYIKIIHSPSDAQLDALYEGALFTIVPSFYEGWGLPVSESLARGKACLTSDGGALPEAGQGLTTCFDPYDLSDGYSKVCDLAFDENALREAEDRVRKHFTPISWEQSAKDILRGASLL